MRIAMFGANGRIGGHVVNWALDAGYPVTALARSPEGLLQSAHRLDPLVLDAAGREAVDPAAGNGTPQGMVAGLSVVRGDALDKAAVAEVIAGADAVISALGPRGAKAPDLLTGAASNIVSAMRQTGVRRLVSVSAAGAFIKADPNMSWLVKQILPRILAKPFADVRGMEDVIRESGLDWTLVRATRLVNRPGTGQYRVSPDYAPRGGWKIARADVAHFIAAVLTGNSWLRSAPALAY
jgi:putative NADH-flavin reductase